MDAREDDKIVQRQVGTIRVLLVGDGSLVESTAEALGRVEDIAVLVETTGADGLERLEAEAIDCIVSDDELPDMSAIGFLRTVRDSDESVGFVLLLGPDWEAQEVAIPAEFTDYVRKRELREEKRYDHLTQRIRNVVARQERQRALTETREGLDEFTSVVSHDLRNPLNVAQSSLHLLDVDNEHVDRLDRSLSRMQAIIDDVVTLTRQGGPVEDATVVDFATKVEDAWRQIESDATLELVASEDRYLAADPDRLHELLANLLQNAVEHGRDDTETGEQVTVTIGLLEDGFFVADDGPGISENDREAVFEPGYSTGRSGTGLGLSIVDAIVTAHDWEVSVEESESGGARFEIRGVDFR